MPGIMADDRASAPVVVCRRLHAGLGWRRQGADKTDPYHQAAGLQRHLLPAACVSIEPLAPVALIKSAELPLAGLCLEAAGTYRSPGLRCTEVQNGSLAGRAW